MRAACCVFFTSGREHRGRYAATLDGEDASLFEKRRSGREWGVLGVGFRIRCLWEAGEGERERMVESVGIWWFRGLSF